MLMSEKMKIKVGFPFCVTALMLLSGELRESFLCAFVISLIHETGHLVAMLVMKIYPRSIAFTPTGIKINCPTGIISPRTECIISASGPLMNVLLMPVLYFFSSELPFYINTGLLIINLLPFRSLDAGRFLYNLTVILKDEFYAEKIMNITETVVCVCLVLLLICLLLNRIVNPSFIALTVMLVVTTVTQLVK